MYLFKARFNLLWDLFLSVQVIVCSACVYMLALYLSIDFDDGFQRTSNIGVILGAFSTLCFLLNLSVSACFIINRIGFKGDQSKPLLIKSTKIMSTISLIGLFMIFFLVVVVTGGLSVLPLIALAFIFGLSLCFFLIAVVFDRCIHNQGVLKQSIIIVLIAFYAWLAIDFVFVQRLVMGEFTSISYGLIALVIVFLLTLVADFFIYKIQQLLQKPQKDHAIL